MLKYKKTLKEPSRELRKSFNQSELRLWTKVRRKQILGLQFYRQKPIGNFIVDFYAPKAKLVIEVDGSQHLEETHALRDIQRDAYLASEGLKILRFSNLDVLKNIEGVMEVIFQTVLERLGNNPSIK
jgi:very-short-patch-repair endonuclease